MVLGDPLVVRHGNLEIRHMAGLGLDPPDFVIEAVRGAVDADASRRLRAAGGRLADRIVKVPGSSSAGGPAGPWERLIAPIVSPLSAGLEARLAPRLAGVAVGLAAAGLAVGYLLGRRR